MSNIALNVVDRKETEYLFDSLEITYFYDSYAQGKIPFLGFDEHLNTCLQGNCNLDTYRIDILRINRGSISPQVRSYTKSILEHLITKFSFEPELITFHDVREKRFLDFAKDKSSGMLNLEQIQKEKRTSVPFIRALDELGYKNVILGGFDTDFSEELYRVKYVQGRK